MHHLGLRNTYGLSKIHGTLIELPQENSNTPSFKASGVEPEQISKGLLTRTLLPVRLQHHKSLKQVHYRYSTSENIIHLNKVNLSEKLVFIHQAPAADRDTISNWSYKCDTI